MQMRSKHVKNIRRVDLCLKQCTYNKTINVYNYQLFTLIHAEIYFSIEIYNTT